MILKYDIWVDNKRYNNNLRRIINQVYKILPLREQGKNWQKPLKTLIQELAGLQRLVIDQDQTFIALLSKLEGLLTLTKQEDFDLYRRTIFECLGLLNKLKS